MKKKLMEDQYNEHLVEQFEREFRKMVKKFANEHNVRKRTTFKTSEFGGRTRRITNFDPPRTSSRDLLPYYFPPDFKESAKRAVDDVLDDLEHLEELPDEYPITPPPRKQQTSTKPDSPDDVEFAECQMCGKKATKKCSKCKDATYCSERCQSADWKIHENICQ